MKQVTDENIAERIALLEHAEAETGQLSLHGESELACLRELRERRGSETALQQKLDAMAGSTARQLESLAGSMLNRTLDSGRKQASAYADCADMVAKFASELRSGTHDTADKVV